MPRRGSAKNYSFSAVRKCPSYTNRDHNPSQVLINKVLRLQGKAKDTLQCLGGAWISFFTYIGYVWSTKYSTHPFGSKSAPFLYHVIFAGGEAVTRQSRVPFVAITISIFVAGGLTVHFGGAENILSGNGNRKLTEMGKQSFAPWVDQVRVFRYLFTFSTQHSNKLVYCLICSMCGNNEWTTTLPK